MDVEHCGRKRGCLLRAISPFYHNVFSQLYIFYCVYVCHFVVMVYMDYNAHIKSLVVMNEKMTIFFNTNRNQGKYLWKRRNYSLCDLSSVHTETLELSQMTNVKLSKFKALQTTIFTDDINYPCFFEWGGGSIVEM